MIFKLFLKLHTKKIKLLDLNVPCSFSLKCVLIVFSSYVATAFRFKPSVFYCDSFCVCVCVCVCVCLCVLSLSQLCPTLWTVACQAPLSMEFSRQEYWSRLSFPTPGDLPNPGMETHISCASCIGRWILYHWVTWEAPLHFLKTKRDKKGSRGQQSQHKKWISNSLSFFFPLAQAS